MSDDASARLAAELSELDGIRSVVGWARLAVVPDERAPRQAAACGFWRLGGDGTVSAGAEHGDCPVGRLTQGFGTAPPPGDPTIAMMVETGYVDPAEFAHLPVLPAGHGGIAYGPPATLPVPAEALLVFADAAALMLLGEALQTARLDSHGLRLMGRPTCAAVSAAVNDGQAVASLGCTGARLHAGMEGSEALVVIPAAQFELLRGELPDVLARNRVVEQANLHAAAAAGSVAGPLP